MPYIKLRSKNPSAADLRTRLSVVRTRNPFVVRLGSRTSLSSSRTYHNATELNTIASIENSRDKLKMKGCFLSDSVSQSRWFLFTPRREFLQEPNNETSAITVENLPYPIVIKQVCGFKGHGMVKCENVEELNTWLSSHSTSGYYVEEFKNFAREYRMHATTEGVFLSWRKLRRADATERWFFNSTNCNWVSEEHEMFEKPEAWDLMCEHAVKAIRATGLSIGAVDVRCKSNCRSEEDFIILETNSAAELHTTGTNAYFEQIVRMVQEKDALL